MWFSAGWTTTRSAPFCRIAPCPRGAAAMLAAILSVICSGWPESGAVLGPDPPADVQPPAKPARGASNAVKQTIRMNALVKHGGEHDSGERLAPPVPSPLYSGERVRVRGHV